MKKFPFRWVTRTLAPCMTASWAALGGHPGGGGWKEKTRLIRHRAAVEGKWTKVKEDQSGRRQCANPWHLKELAMPPIQVQQVSSLCEPKDINRKPTHLKGFTSKIKPMDTFWVWVVQTYRHFQGKKITPTHILKYRERVLGPGPYVTGSNSFQMALDNLKAVPDNSILTSSLACGYWVDGPSKDHLGSNSHT